MFGQYGDVDGSGASSNGKKKLSTALSADGGKLIALGRHAVAAYRNASTLNYGMTPAEVVTLFNNAFASGNKDFIEAQKKILEDLNQQQLCPLN
jgi:hypothetical protein